MIVMRAQYQPASTDDLSLQRGQDWPLESPKEGGNVVTPKLLILERQHEHKIAASSPNNSILTENKQKLYWGHLLPNSC